MACWRDTWFPGNGMVLSEVRPIVAVLLTSRSKGSPPAELTRNFAGISSRYDGMAVVRLPAAMSGPLPTRPALFSTAGAGLSSGRSYKNNLTSHAQPPRVGGHSIKSGGGTGPAMPRQPVPRKRNDQVPIPGSKYFRTKMESA